MKSTFSAQVSTIYPSTISFIGKHKTYTAFLFIILSVILMYGLYSEPRAQKETYAVVAGPIKQYVKISGQVQSSKDANLSFQSTGAVSYISVRPGDAVPQGKVLATIRGGDAQAALLQAEASLENAQAVLEQLEQGSRKEEIALKEQALSNAQDSLTQAYGALPDTIQNVDAITSDVIKNKFSSLFIFSNTRYLLSFSSCDQTLQSEIEIKRTNLENTLADFQKKSSTVSALSSPEVIDAAFAQAYQATLMTNDLVSALSHLLLLSCSASNSSLDVYRSTLTGVKTSMTSLFSDISGKRSSLLIAKNTFKQAAKDLELTKAGTDPYRIKAQTAVVSQAEAQVASARSGVQKTLIISPFSGVITNVDISIGETIPSGKTVISMQAIDGFEIEAKVPEIDIIKIKVGAPVEVTLDAYGKATIFKAVVTRINPSATMDGGVPVYKVIVTFMGKDTRIKQGMTANVEISTESKSKVLIVPARFIKIISKDKGEVIQFKDGKERTKEIKLGIRGSEGLFEVLDGVLIGDVLVPPATETRQAQKQNN